MRVRNPLIRRNKARGILDYFNTWEIKENKLSRCSTIILYIPTTPDEERGAAQPKTALRQFSSQSSLHHCATAVFPSNLPRSLVAFHKRTQKAQLWWSCFLKN